MINNDKTQIIDELIGKIEGQLDCIHVLLDQHRKDTIGVLQALKQDIEEEDIDRAIDVADKTNKNFEFFLKKLGGI